MTAGGGNLDQRVLELKRKPEPRWSSSRVPRLSSASLPRSNPVRSKLQRLNCRKSEGQLKQITNSGYYKYKSITTTPSRINVTSSDSGHCNLVTRIDVTPKSIGKSKDSLDSSAVLPFSNVICQPRMHSTKSRTSPNTTPPNSTRISTSTPRLSADTSLLYQITPSPSHTYAESPLPGESDKLSHPATIPSSSNTAGDATNSKYLVYSGNQIRFHRSLPANIECSVITSYKATCEVDSSSRVDTATTTSQYNGTTETLAQFIPCNSHIPTHSNKHSSIATADPHCKSLNSQPNNQTCNGLQSCRIAPPSLTRQLSDYTIGDNKCSLNVAPKIIHRYLICSSKFT